jgi:hypothetical protein
MTAEIETVTASFDEVKANVEHYYWLKETRRLVVVRDGMEIAILGRWLPGERRLGLLHWFELLYEMFPEPWDPDDPEKGPRSVEESRGYRPRAISIHPPSSS